MCTHGSFYTTQLALRTLRLLSVLCVLNLDAEIAKKKTQSTQSCINGNIIAAYRGALVLLIKNHLVSEEKIWIQVFIKSVAAIMPAVSARNRVSPNETG